MTPNPYNHVCFFLGGGNVLMYCCLLEVNLSGCLCRVGEYPMPSNTDKMNANMESIGTGSSHGPYPGFVNDFCYSGKHLLPVWTYEVLCTDLAYRSDRRELVKLLVQLMRCSGAPF